MSKTHSDTFQTPHGLVNAETFYVTRREQQVGEGEEKSVYQAHPDVEQVRWHSNYPDANPAVLTWGWEEFWGVFELKDANLK